ncbi:hypothetical protein WJX81_008478 [Elliptochloris bilobata]|uniref:Fungal lipase-type domain-containing protein n=1 Tax=Elliptochloris bilobata TaxID=381761 RepID=A0AAW1RUR4_9CHLO
MLAAAIIKVSKLGSAAPDAFVVAFRGSEPFAQADWFMDFDFILSNARLGHCPPRHGNLHSGFRLGLGLDLDLVHDLPSLVTFCRSYTDFPGQGLQARMGACQEPRSAYMMLADALTEANGRDLKITQDLPGLTTTCRSYTDFPSQGPVLRWDAYQEPQSAYSILVTALTQRLMREAIYVAGHSLGGGLAHLFAVTLMLRDCNGFGARLAQVYTYAQPRIGDKTFVATSNSVLKGKHNRAVNAVDIVPRTPPLKDTYIPNVLACLEQWVLKKHIIDYGHAGEARLCEKIVQVPQPTVLRLAFHIIPLVWAISDHFMGFYLNMYFSP